MLLLVARPVPQSRPIYSATVDSTVIRLPPLTQEESEALVDALVGPLVSASGPVLREFVTRRAAGNPFFLEEAVHALMDAGMLLKTPEGAQLPETTTLDIPATVQGVILSRLDSLAPDARSLLLEAAVIGPSFDLETLRRISTRPQELQGHLETLLHVDKSGVIRYVYTCGPLGAIPSNAALLRQLATL
jgi:predicted ATPase